MRPRWRSLGRRRPTTHRLRPEQRGGRRRNDFLVSRGMAALGVPMHLRHGVGAGRGRKSRRAVAAQAVEASAVLRPDQPIEEAVWSALGTDWQRRRWRPKRIQQIATSSLASSTHSRRREAHAPPTTRPPVALPSCHQLVGLPCGIDRRKFKSTNEAAPAWPLLDPWHAARLLQPPMMRKLGLRRSDPPASLARV